ncbi:MAG: Response regulator MprA [Anaerolineales bacterium]|nr:Response regulator MprA [Anaerolineales bacterium]
MAEQILIVEDDAPIADFVRRGLLLEDYAVDVAYDGQAGLAKAKEDSPALVILDIMLPGMDGLEVCRQLRRHSDVPVIMLTAKDDVPDRVAGLEAGADDYLVKPFAFDELLARIRALLRRHRPSTSDELHFAGLRLNPVTREVYRVDRPIDLTAKEYDLLELFMRHPRQVLTRDTIYEQVWGYDFQGESNIIEVYIRYLRTKLEADGEPRLIQTVRGVGYTLRES